MHEPLYRQALSHSWQFAWKNKFLWVFGLFAALLGQMGLLDLLTKIGFASSDFALYPNWLASPQLWQASVANGALSLPLDGWVWFVWLFIIFFALAIILTFVAVVSQGAIVRAVYQSVHHRDVDVSTSWHAGVTHFWRLLFLNVIKKLVMVLLALAVGYAVLNFVIVESVSGFFLFLLLFLLAIAIGVILSFLVIYAAGYVVVEEYKLGKSILAAWHLFTSHWLVSIEVGVIVLFLNFILGIVIMLGFCVFFLPTLICWFVGLMSANAALITAGLIVGVILFLIFIVFLGTLFALFTTSVWTYLFMKMHHEGVKSRLLHWFGH